MEDAMRFRLEVVPKARKRAAQRTPRRAALKGRAKRVIQWRYRSVVACVARLSRPLGEWFRSPAGERVTFSLLAQRKSNQKERAPCAAPSAANAAPGALRAGPAFRSGILARIEKAGTSVSPPAYGGLIVQPSPPRREGKSKADGASASPRSWRAGSLAPRLGTALLLLPSGEKAG